MNSVKPKQKILIFIDWFLPGYKAGGPVRSMANMVEYLKEDYQFYIYTSNFEHDGGILNILSDQWLVHSDDAAQVYYASKPGYGEVRKVLIDIKPDVVYLNSVFSPKFTLLPLFLNRFCSKVTIAKVVFAPRGMFQKGALQLKAGKKRLFLNLVKPLLFKAGNIVWHATDKQEVKDIRSEIGEKATIKEVSNIPTTKVVDYGITLPEDEIRFVTISLVAEKKNHIFFLQLLKGITVPEGKKIVYDIYGPIKDEAYWSRCQALIMDMPDGVEVNYKGSVIPTKVNETLQAYHYFVLPTLGENFGHAIFEALVNGLPVLISDLTPWRNLEAMKAGWDIKLEMREKKREGSVESEVQGSRSGGNEEERGDCREDRKPASYERSEAHTWLSALECILTMTPEEHQQWQQGAKNVANKHIADQNYKRAYKNLLGHRK